MRPDPFDLRNRALTDRKAVESLLFDAFISAAYRHDPGGRWTAQDAGKWLVFLARHLERKVAGPDLAWWQLRRSMPRTAVEAVAVAATAAGVAAGVMAGLAMAAFVVVARARVPAGVVVGLMVGVGVMAGVAGLVGRGSAEAPARGVRVSGPGGMPVGALMAGLVIFLGVAAALEGGSVAAVVLGLAIVAAFAAGIMAVAGLEGVPGDLAEAASPQAVLAHDRRMALLLTLAAGPGAGIIVGVMAGSVAGPGAGIAIGVLAGAGVGLGVSAAKQRGRHTCSPWGGWRSATAASAADELPRRCPPARSLETSRRGLPVPAHRTTAPAGQPGRGQAASEFTSYSSHRGAG